MQELFVFFQQYLNCSDQFRECRTLQVFDIEMTKLAQETPSQNGKSTTFDNEEVIPLSRGE